MQGYAFAPANLTVPAGSTVTWTNQDTAPHDVKTTSGPVQIHSPMLNKGQSWSFTFTTAGSYAYYCTVHPNMTAGIAVQAAAPATSAAPTHSHAHTGTGSEPHEAGTETGTGMGMGMGRSTASSSRTPTRTAPSSAAAPKSPGRASPTPTAPAAAPPAPSSPPLAGAAPQVQTTTVASARPLDPLLLLTGIVAGIAVLCLLLVGSRAAAPRGREKAEVEAEA
jgi:amicyanin